MIQERIPQIIYQLKIYSKDEKGLGMVRVVLLNLGYAQEDLVRSDSKKEGIIELFDEHPAKLKKVRDLFNRLRFPAVRLSLHSLLPKDWLTVWKKQWKPAPLTKKLDVVPVWYQNKYRPRKGCDYILMDTLLSFGTGLHETTRFMAQFIENRKGSFKSFLDIGTGTGILSLVALKHGAEDVQAIDIGELSVKAAYDNMKVNGLPFKVVMADIRKYSPRKKFDFVAANLITEDLIENAQKILSFVKDDGWLAVSGISLDNFNKFRRRFSILPLKCLKISKGKQWSGLLFQKTM